MVRPNPRFDPVSGTVTTPTTPRQPRPNPRYGNNVTYSLSLNQLNENINRIKQEIDLIYDPAWMMSPTDKNPIPVGWARLGDETTTMLNPAYPQFTWSDKLEFAGGHQGTDPRYRPSPIRNPEPNSEIERNFGIFTAKTAIQYLKDSVRYWQAVKAKYDYQCSQTAGARECELGASLGAGLLNEMSGMIQKLEKEKREMDAGTHRNIPEQYRTAQAQQFEFFPEASAQEEIITNGVIEPEPITATITQPVTFTPIPEPVNETITDNMIIQRLDNFSIVNGRAKGQITFTATDSFNPNYYGKNITNVIQFKTPNDVSILPFIKQNTLRFTATERDETIHYDEDMQGNTRAMLESFVWSNVTQPTAFSKKLSYEISETEAPKPVGVTGIMGAGVAGAIGILILLGFITDSRRKK